MIDVLKRNILEDPTIQKIVSGSLIATGGANLLDWIDIASSVISIIAVLAGAILAIFMAYNGWQKIRHARLEYKILKEKARKDFESISN